MLVHMIALDFKAEKKYSEQLNDCYREDWQSDAISCAEGKINGTTK